MVPLASCADGFVISLLHGPGASCLHHEAIRAGRRVFTWHGKLGKYIIAGAMVNFLLAVYFWPWSMAMKLPLGLVLLGSGLLASMLPRHMGQQNSSLPLVSASAAIGDDAASSEMAQLACSS
mmetsp:Transcript_44610/g.100496  ORF Transcript_44610/g.100496 Transcript_44610/m.100496 type:complete len:122 (-) Transcript_44610:94-459(-)